MVAQRIGSILGIPLFLDPSWFFILVLITYLDGQTWLERYGDWGLWAWGAGFLTALCLFASVLLHELGHSVAALSQGIRVNSITLFLFGGVASIEEESKTPGKAFQVAIAGPAVSFALWGILSGVQWFLPSQHPSAVLLDEVAHVNQVLGIFNLIPGLPLDGGQILKALVWKITQNRFKAVYWAAQSGKFLGSTAIALGILLVLLQQSFGAFWIILLGFFGLRNANAYEHITTLQEALLSIRAQDALTRNYRVVDAHLTLRQFAEQYLLEEKHPLAYYGASDGRYRGLLSLEHFRDIERSRWDVQRLEDILYPLPTIPTVPETAPLGTIVTRLHQSNLTFVTVLSPAGAVSGVIDRGDIVRALAQRLNLTISETEIRRIREDGTYPPGLPLVSLAQSIQGDLEQLDQR
jgi:Zn-dependent protease